MRPCTCLHANAVFLPPLVLAMGQVHSTEALADHFNVMASLLVVRGTQIGTYFLLRRETQRIGRDSHCDIHFDDSETSRVHAQIEHTGDQFLLRDLRSSNGTFVNGKQIESHVLMVGDRVQIGKQLLLFRLAFEPTGQTDSNVDIVPSESNESSQIVGRVGIVQHLSEQTNDWSGQFEPSQGSGTDTAADTSMARSHWEVMYKTAIAVSRTMDIDQLLHQIMELIFQWVRCDRGCIMLTDPETNELRASCRRNRTAASSKAKMTISRTILDYVCKNDEGVLTSDACDDNRWANSASISAGGIREAICVPMQGRYGNVGVIYIDTSTSAGRYAQMPERVFNEEHLKLLIAIGHQAALAIEDTTHYQNLVQAERLAIMGQTIATLSHHIKNIVQGLKGGGYLINQGLQTADWSPTKNGWRICERNHERMESLVLDMLTMSKDRKPEVKETDLREILDDAIDLMKSRAEEKNVTLDWNRPAEPLPMMLEAEAIHRVLLNLIGNAIDACIDRPKSLVSVRIHSDETKVRVLIRDNGVGIAPEDSRRIFSMFESNKGSRGTGLGLPVSLKIAKEHGGSIEVKSELGNGAEFEFSLPREQPKLVPTIPG
jgi:two-component system, NtrC family, sensor kinase